MAKKNIKMNYPMVERMAQTMKRSDKTLERCIDEMNKIISTLEQGGLRGDAGAAFAQTMRQSLIPSIQRLRAKSEEENKDLQKNIEIMKAADRKSARGHRTG